MNRQTAARSLLVTSLILAPFCHAGTEIVKCVGANGRVTLTDQPCQGGERSEIVLPGSPAGNEDSALAPLPAQGAAPAQQMAREHQSAPARLDPPGRSLARDVATLKAARRTMLLMDDAASALRAQRIALH